MLIRDQKRATESKKKNDKLIQLIETDRTH